MKAVNPIRLAVAAMAFAAGTDSVAADYTPQVLNEAWMVKMDADGDGKVSRDEYVMFATDYLQKSGKPVDRKSLLDKFNGYDWNRDGFITDEDPLCPDPVEVFLEKIKGRWLCETNAKGLVSFTFMDDGEADVVRNGLSLRDETDGLLTYSIEHPGRNPVCMDISVGKGTSYEWNMKCILQILEDNRIKMRAFMGDSYTSFPKEFIPGDDADTYYLTRVVKKEKPIPEENPKSKNNSQSKEITLFGITVPTGR